MVLSFRTPQAVAAATHSQPVLHACPPPPPPLTFVSYWSSSAFIIVLFLYSEQIFDILGISCKQKRRHDKHSSLLPPSCVYRFSSEAWTALPRDLCVINPSPPEITSAHMFCAISMFALLQQCVRQTRKNKQSSRCHGGTPSPCKRCNNHIRLCYKL